MLTCFASMVSAEDVSAVAANDWCVSILLRDLDFAKRSSHCGWTLPRNQKKKTQTNVLRLVKTRPPQTRRKNEANGHALDVRWMEEGGGV